MVRRNGEKKDEKRDEKEDKRDDKPNLRREMRKRVAQRHHWGLYTAVSHNTLVGTEEPLNTFYMTLEHRTTLFPYEAIYMLTRSWRGSLGYQQLTVERFTLMVLGPCEWQHKPAV